MFERLVSGIQNLLCNVKISPCTIINMTSVVVALGNFNIDKYLYYMEIVNLQ